MKKIVPLLFFVAAVAAIVVAVKYLPWWALVLAVAALIVAGKFVIKGLLFRLLVKPFQLKGAVLKGATAEVHSVRPAPASANDAEASDTAGTPYSVEVTIRPGSTATPFTAWEPGELRLVSPENVIDPKSGDDDDDTCEIKSVEVEQEGGFKPDEGFKFQGAQRLRLLITVKPGATRLKFRYYFEEFGSVSLPGSVLPQAA